MTALDHADLRMFFMREGKLAGSCAAWVDEGDPAVVTGHLALLNRLLSGDLASMTGDEQSSLLGVFLSAARKCRTGQVVDTAPDELDESSVLSRVFSLEGLPRNEALQKLALDSHEESRAHASADALRIVERATASIDEHISSAELRHLHEEVGRLTGPLWLPKQPCPPDVMSDAFEVLARAFENRVAGERAFDNATATFVTLTWEDGFSEHWEASFGTARKSQRQYFSDFPLGAALPENETERIEEEKNRASHRLHAIQRSTTAIEELLAPLAAQLKALFELEEAAREQEARALEERHAKSGFPKPEAQVYGVSPRGAEFWVGEAMRWLGAQDAEVTQQSGDGGVDVVSHRFAVSVKHYAGSVPVEEIREIFGVAISLGKLPVLWTSGTLTKAASDFADLAPVAVIQYRVEDATIVGLNATGRQLMGAGAGDEL